MKGFRFNPMIRLRNYDGDVLGASLSKQLWKQIILSKGETFGKPVFADAVTKESSLQDTTIIMLGRISGRP